MQKYLNKRVVLLSVMLLTSLISLSSQTVVHANDTNPHTQVDKIRTIVREEGLKDLVTTNPISEVVLKLQEQKVGETQSDYLKNIVRTSMKEGMVNIFDDLKIVDQPGRLVVRITGYTYGLSSLGWLDEASELLKQEEGIDKISWQIWGYNNGMLAIEV